MSLLICSSSQSAARPAADREGGVAGELQIRRRGVGDRVVGAGRQVRRRAAQQAWDLVTRRRGDAVHDLVAVRDHQLAQVVAGVAVLGNVGSHPVRLQQARVRRPRQGRDLLARVVDVILARDVEAGERHQTRHRVAEHRAAAMADVQRAGRIGADELDQHPPSAADVRPAELGPLDLAEDLRPESRREAEVEIAGTGDLDVGEQARGILDVVDDRLGDRDRRLALGARQAERHRRGEVAERRVLGDLKKQRGEAFQLQRSPLFGSDQRVLKQPLKPVSHPPPASATHCRHRSRRDATLMSVES